MRAAGVAIAVVAACGGSKPPAPKPAEPEPTHRTRTVPVADTEPEDGVEVVASHGHMDPAAVDAGLAPHKDEMFACYTSRVGNRRWLGGKLTLHWDINKAGEVTKVLLADSDVGAWPVEKCVLEIARAATFGKPIGGDADFQIPLSFNPVRAAIPWDDDQAGKAVTAQLLAKLDKCARAKGVKGGSPADVALTIYVGPQGRVQSVGFASGKTVLDDAWADCAEKAVLAWRLPDPKGTYAKLTVHYR